MHHLVYLHLGHFICKTELSTLMYRCSPVAWRTLLWVSDTDEGQYHLVKDHFKWPTSIWLVVWLLLLHAVFNLPSKEFIKCAYKSNTWERIKNNGAISWRGQRALQWHGLIKMPFPTNDPHFICHTNSTLFAYCTFEFNEICKNLVFSAKEC